MAEFEDFDPKYKPTKPRSQNISFEDFAGDAPSSPKDIDFSDLDPSYGKPPIAPPAPTVRSTLDGMRQQPKLPAIGATDSVKGILHDPIGAAGSVIQSIGDSYGDAFGSVGDLINPDMQGAARKRHLASAELSQLPEFRQMDARGQKQAIDEASLPGAGVRDPWLNVPVAREVTQGLASAGQQVASMATRPFSAEGADALSRSSRQTMASGGDSIPSRILTSASSSIPMTIIGSAGNIPGIIALHTTNAMNMATQNGRDAGLKGSNLATYVAGEGVAEGAVTSLFQIIGIPGLEGMFGQAGRTAIKSGLKEGLKRFGVASLQELPEEYTVEVASGLNNYLHGLQDNVMPSADNVAVLVGSTLLSVGAVQSAQSINQGQQPAVAPGQANQPLPDQQSPVQPQPVQAQPSIVETKQAEPDASQRIEASDIDQIQRATDEQLQDERQNWESSKHPQAKQLMRMIDAEVQTRNSARQRAAKPVTLKEASLEATLARPSDRPVYSEPLSADELQQARQFLEQQRLDEAMEQTPQAFNAPGIEQSQILPEIVAGPQNDFESLTTMNDPIVEPEPVSLPEETDVEEISDANQTPVPPADEVGEVEALQDDAVQTDEVASPVGEVVEPDGQRVDEVESVDVVDGAKIASLEKALVNALNSTKTGKARADGIANAKRAYDAAFNAAKDGERANRKKSSANHAKDVYDAVSRAVDSGKTIYIQTRTRTTSITKATIGALRWNPVSGNIELRRGNNWDAIIGETVVSLANQVGVNKPEYVDVGIPYDPYEVGALDVSLADYIAASTDDADFDAARHKAIIESNAETGDIDWNSPIGKQHAIAYPEIAKKYASPTVAKDAMVEPETTSFREWQRQQKKPDVLSTKDTKAEHVPFDLDTTIEDMGRRGAAGLAIIGAAEKPTALQHATAKVYATSLSFREAVDKAKNLYHWKDAKNRKEITVYLRKMYAFEQKQVDASPTIKESSTVAATPVVKQSLTPAATVSKTEKVESPVNVAPVVAKTATTQSTRKNREMDHTGRPLDKGSIHPGDTFKTTSGRETTPFPKTSARNHKGDERKINQWTIENAVAEAKSRGDDYNARGFGSESAGNFPPASADSLTEYLFGQQPRVLRPFLKPVESNQSTADRIIASGVDPETAQANAVILDAAFESIAKRSGKTVAELKEKYGPVMVDGKSGNPAAGDNVFQTAPPVESEAFKKMFGDSKVVDGQGNPLPMYHGTNGDFDRVDDGINLSGFFFTADANEAGEYASRRRGSGNIMPVYLSLKNPASVEQYSKALSKSRGGNPGRMAIEIMRNDGHDGVVFRNSDGTIFRAIAFSPTQIKSVNNRGTFDPNDPNILRQDVDQNDLVLTHNLTVKNMAHAIKMGGIAVPSLAVVNKDNPLFNFGEITLIGSKDMADPKGYAKTKVYGADIYSPRYPSVSYDVEYKAVYKLNDLLADAQSKTGYRKLEASEIDNRGIYELETNANVMYSFLKEQGHEPDIEPGEDNGYKNNRLQSEQIDELGLRDEYNSYVEKMMASLEPKERIFKGFTPSGNRRYEAHTLENVVKILKKKMRSGEGFNYGAGSLRAKLTPQFKSIAQIKKEKGRLTSKKNFEKIKEEVTNELFEIDDETGIKNTDKTIELLSDAAKVGVNGAERIHNQFYGSQGGSIELSDEAKKHVVEYLTKLKNMPTEYFEAKITRSVDLSEFAGSVVPKDMSPSIINAMKKAGVTDIKFYERNDEASRKEAIGKFSNAFFQQKQNQRRGSLTIGKDRKMTITMFDKADKSTFLHETGHLYLEMMGDLAGESGATQGLKDDYATLLKWFGVTSRGQVKREHHEQFARGFEAYLMEGKAPTPALKQAFQNFAKWLTDIYKSVKKLNVTLTPEVRAVMDRMLSGEDVISTQTKESSNETGPAAKKREAGIRLTDEGNTQTIEDVGIKGNPGTLILADGTSHEIRYIAIDAEEITPSHDARKGFAINEAGAWNERPYHDPKEGASSRQTVMNIADSPTTSLLVTDTPTPIDGPPIVTTDGVVLGGNARSMGVQLAYRKGGDAAESIHKATIDAASKFGISLAEISDIKNPIIVRVLFKVSDRRAMYAILNQPMTTGKTQSTDAVSRANRITEKTADTVAAFLKPDADGETPSIREVMADPRKATRIIQMMVRDGVWTQQDIDRLTDTRTNLINDDGKNLLEKTLVGKIVDDPAMIANMTGAVKGKIMSSLGLLTKAINSDKHGPRIREVLKTAIEAYPDYKASGMSIKDYFFDQQTLMPIPGQQDHAVSNMVRAFETLGPRQFASSVKTMMKSLDIVTGDSTGSFDFIISDKSYNIDDAVADAFGGDGRGSSLFQTAPPTASDAFRKWFGDSKAVGEDGYPLALNHQTHEDFNTFDRHFATNRFGRNPDRVDAIGLWFTDDLDTSMYGPKNIQVYLSVENPIVYSDIPGSVAWRQLNSDVEDSGGADKFRESMKAIGHDGVLLKKTKLDGVLHSVWIAFDNTQIKSINNRGTFDANDPNILYQDVNDDIESNTWTDATTNKAAQWAMQTAGKAVETSADVSRRLLKRFGQGVRSHLRAIVAAWKKLMASAVNPRRAAGMALIPGVPGRRTIKQQIAETTGKAKHPASVAEPDALKASMKKAVSASNAGYRAGRDDTKAVSKTNLAERLKTLKDDMKAKRATQDELRAQAVGIATRVLPNARRGNVIIKYAMNATTPAKLKRTVEAISRILNAHLKSESIKDLAKLVGKPIREKKETVGMWKADDLDHVDQEDKPVGMVRKLKLNELSRKYRAVLSPLVISIRRKQAFHGAKNLAEFLNETPGNVMTEEELQIVKDADGKSLANVTPDAIKMVRNAIAHAAALNNSEFSQMVKGKVTTRDAIVKDVVANITRPGRKAINEVADSLNAGDKSILKRFGTDQFSPETDFQILDGSSHGPLTDVAIKQIRRAEDRSLREARKWDDHLSTLLNKAGVPSGSRKLNDFLVTPVTITLPDAGSIKMSRGHMVSLAATYSDSSTRPLMDRGLGINFDFDKLAPEIKLTPADLEAVESQITPGERSLIDGFQTYNRANLRDPMFDAKYKLTGWVPDAVEKYFPRFRNRDANHTDGMTQSWSQSMRKLFENTGRLKERAADMKTPLLIKSIVEVINEYVDDAANIIHMAETYRNAAMVLEDKRVKSAIKRYEGESHIRKIEGFLMDIVKVDRRGQSTVLDRASRGLQRNLSAAVLQLNPSPWLKQIGGVMKMLPEFDLADFIHGLSHISNGSTFREMYENSAVMWDRYNNGLYRHYSPIMGSVMQPIAQMNLSEALRSAASQPFRDGALSALEPSAWGRTYRDIRQAVDALSIMDWFDSIPMRVAYAASRSMIDRTQPHLAGQDRMDAILEKFHESIYRTQNGNTPTETSFLASRWRQSPISSSFLMFTSDSNKALNQLVRSRYQSPSDLAKTVAGISGNIGWSMAVGTAMKISPLALAGLVYGRQLDEEEVEKIIESGAWRMLSDLSGLFYGGGVAVDVIESVINAYSRSPIAPTAEQMILGLIESMTHAAKAATAYMDDNPEMKSGPNKGKSKAMVEVKRAAESLLVHGANASGLPVSPTYFLARRFLSDPPAKKAEPKKFYN